MVSSIKDIHRYVFGDVFLDFENFSVHKAGQIRPLTPRAFDVLVYLVENGGRVVEKQELFEKVWHEKFVSDNALTRAVKEVRHAIGDSAESPLYIETVPKRGYRFIAPVETLSTGPTESVAVKTPRESERVTNGQSRDIQRVIPRPKNPTLRLLVGLAGVAILTTVSVLLFWLSKQPQPAKPIIARNRQITTWTGLDTFPTLSPDGNSVAYSSDHEGNFEIYVRQITTGAKENALTADGQQNLEPSWSPDGKFIAYYSHNRGGIWLIPASGGTARQLTEFGSRPAWSSDSSRLAFQSGGLDDISSNSTVVPTSTIWIVSIHGGDPVQITKAGNPIGGHGSPSWSPDSSSIIFCANDISHSIIWKVSVDGRQLMRMTPANQNFCDPIYAPDGQSILMVSNGVWRLPLAPDGTALREPELMGSRGPATIRNVSASSDGKRVAYSLVQQTGNLWSVPLTRSVARAAGPPVPFVEDSSQRKTNPVFSPDGRKIAYTAMIAGNAGSVWTADADGRNRVQLTTDPSTIVGWLDPGQVATVAYLEEKSFVVATTLETVRKKTLAELTVPFSFPRLSPDGKKIAFNAFDGGSMNLWLYSLADGSLKQLTFDQESQGFASWSPDGKWIAAEVKRKDDTYILLIPVEGGESIQLNTDRGQSWPASWSPDGDKIVFAGCRKGVWNIWWISRTTKQQERLTNYSNPSGFVRYPTWSPLGDQIVYEYAELKGNIWLAEVK